jgi:hypothetical protein
MRRYRAAHEREPRSQKGHLQNASSGGAEVGSHKRPVGQDEQMGHEIGSRGLFYDRLVGVGSATPNGVGQAILADLSDQLGCVTTERRPHFEHRRRRAMSRTGRSSGKASTFMLASWLQPMDLQDAHTDRTP